MAIRISYLCLLMFFSQTSIAQWDQQGSNIVIPSLTSFSGVDVAMNHTGDVVAMANPMADTDESAVIGVYEWSGSNWDLKGDYVPIFYDIPVYGYHFGQDVVEIDSSGSILAIGELSTVHEYSAIIKVYSFLDDEWVQIGDDIVGAFDGDRFGYAFDLSADGKRIVVGASSHDDVLAAGLVRVYEFDGSDWEQIGSTLVGEDGDNIGHHVCISNDGNTIAYNSDSEFASDYLSVYHLNLGEWELVNTPINLDFEINGYDGGIDLNSVGDMLIIGGPEYYDPVNNIYGITKVYKNNGFEWEQQGSSIRGGALEFPLAHHSGRSVKINNEGCIIAIGGYAEDPVEYGGVTVIYRYEEDDWALINEPVYNNDETGFSIGLNAKGNRFIAGSPQLSGGLMASKARAYYNENAECCRPTDTSFAVDVCINYTVPSGHETYFEPGVYFDTIPNSCGLDSLLTITVQFTDRPEVVASADPIISCQGTPILFTGDGAEEYEWDKGVLNGILHTPDTSGILEYTVIGKTGYDCYDTSSISIVVLERPELFFGADTIITIGGTANLWAEGEIDGIYHWYPKHAVSCFDCQETITSPVEDTKYEVLYIAENGCRAKGEINVLVNYIKKIGVPTAFSPNGDGENDILYVKGDNIEALEFKVYNRYGELVFISNDQAEGWDGTFLGREMNPGVFIWVLHYNFVDGSIGQMKGQVTLFR